MPSVYRRSSAPCPTIRYLRKVLSAAAPGSREAGLRRLEESGVRVLTGMRVGSVKEGGVVVLQGGKVRGVPASYICFFTSCFSMYFFLSSIFFHERENGTWRWMEQIGVESKLGHEPWSERTLLCFCRDRKGGVIAYGSDSTLEYNRPTVVCFRQVDCAAFSSRCFTSDCVFFPSTATPIVCSRSQSRSRERVFHVFFVILAL